MRGFSLPGRRLLVAAGLTAALAAPVAIFTGIGSAASTTSSQSQYAPTNTGAPQITGTAQEGQTLTATTGTWSSSSNITYSFQWQRCNSTGAACVSIAGATAQTYAVTTADVGNTLRVVVTAHNADGAASANSATTAVVTAKSAQGGGSTNTSTLASAQKESNGRTSISTSDVSLPDRLVIDKVQFSPNPVRSMTSITARFHITDTQHGYDVRDALVYAIGLPYSRVSVPAEVKSGTDGWATVTFNPDRFFPQKGYITFFVRARKSGGDPLAGVSTRRLVQVTINR